MGRLEDKLSNDGRGILRIVLAVLHARALRLALEGKDMGEDLAREIKRTIGSSPNPDYHRMVYELMKEEYFKVKKLKEV